MKYALHAWCDKKFLEQADEIIVEYKERERLLDYPSNYPNATVTIQHWKNDDEFIDWKWLSSIKEQFPKGFSLGVMNYHDLLQATEWHIPAYMLKHINNFAELNLAKQNNACFVYVDQPLFSSIEKLKHFNIPVRWTPNIVDSSPGYLALIDRLIHGTWIRPEDIDKYDILPGCVCEFPSTNGHPAEQAFFKIYKDQKQWEQDLGYLLLDFKGKGIANYLIDPELINTRLNCHQRCEEIPYGNGCHACDNVFSIANHDRIEEYLKEIKARHEAQEQDE